jgi:hypothetical protein
MDYTIRIMLLPLKYYFKYINFNTYVQTVRKEETQLYIWFLI